MKLIRLALSYSYHLPKLLVSVKYYLLNESEQLGILYCVMFSIGYMFIYGTNPLFPYSAYCETDFTM